MPPFNVAPENYFSIKQNFLKSLISLLLKWELPVFKTTKAFEFHIQPQPSFNKQFDLLLNNLNDNHFNGYKTICFVRMMPSQEISRYLRIS